MKFLSSLDPRDRKLVLWFLSIGGALAVVLGFLLPKADSNENPLPSSYLAGQHGARAAYETLLRSNYSLERWERPLGELAAIADDKTVVIFADPMTREPANLKAVRQILERGGRVLSTGFWGAFILPGEQGETPTEFTFSACNLEPSGLDPLANSGEVWMVPQASWKMGDPAHRVQYTCAGQPAVIEFNWGKGHAVWWASATPLENGSLSREGNLDLLLNSLGPREGHKFYWDESLHGEVRSSWSYVSGPAWTMLWSGLAILGMLIVFSFSRRSGPLRELPAVQRASPVEFLDALGSLYRNAGAASTAVAVALERYKKHVQRACGLRTMPDDLSELANAIHRRFPSVGPSLESDLAACEEAAASDLLAPRDALRLIQRLHDYEQALAESTRDSTYTVERESHKLKERAS